jgi:hypothetical protein
MASIPQEIKKAIRQGAKHYEKAREQNQIVRDWLESIGQEDHDGILDQIIDGMENANRPDEAIKYIEMLLDEASE